MAVGQGRLGGPRGGFAEILVTRKQVVGLPPGEWHRRYEWIGAQSAPVELPFYGVEDLGIEVQAELFPARITTLPWPLRFVCESGDICPVGIYIREDAFLWPARLLRLRIAERWHWWSRMIKARVIWTLAVWKLATVKANSVADWSDVHAVKRLKDRVARFRKAKVRRVGSRFVFWFGVTMASLGVVAMVTFGLAAAAGRGPLAESPTFVSLLTLFVASIAGSATMESIRRRVRGDLASMLRVSRLRAAFYLACTLLLVLAASAEFYVARWFDALICSAAAAAAYSSAKTIGKEIDDILALMASGAISFSIQGTVSCDGHADANSTPD